MRLAEINQRQHHENKGLQGDDQDVKYRPDRARNDCLLYTSDAADERSSVDLGGRRIIKKRKKKKNRRHN